MSPFAKLNRERYLTSPRMDVDYICLSRPIAKGWRYRYFFQGAEKMLASGTCPDVSLVDARERLDAARQWVARGIDSSIERKNKNSRSAISLRWSPRHWLAHARSARLIALISATAAMDCFFSIQQVRLECPP